MQFAALGRAILEVLLSERQYFSQRPEAISFSTYLQQEIGHRPVQPNFFFS
jgi:hypothetical protein